MNDFEDRARAAADALGSDNAFGDPAVVRNRLRRRRAVRVLATSAAVVVGIGAFSVARRDGPLRIGTTGSTRGATTSTVDGSTTSLPATTSTTATTVPTLPNATQAPSVIVGTDAGFVTIRSGDIQVDHQVAVADHAYRMRDGSLIAAVDDPEVPDEVTAIWRFRPGSAGTPIPELDSYRLLGSGIVGGDDVVLVAPPSPHASLVTQAAVVVYNVRTGSMRSIGQTWGAGEGSSHRATIAGDVLLVFGNDGQTTTTVDYYDVTTGNRIAGRPMQTAISNAPEAASGPSQVVISPDGNRVAYFDAPTSWDSTGGSAPATDLVIIDARTGAELQRTTLTPSVDVYSWLEFDGRWAIASRFIFPGSSRVLPAVVVDTRAAQPTAAQIPGALGTTTLDSAP